MHWNKNAQTKDKAWLQKVGKYDEERLLGKKVHERLVSYYPSYSWSID